MVSPWVSDLTQVGLFNLHHLLGETPRKSQVTDQLFPGMIVNTHLSEPTSTLYTFGELYAFVTLWTLDALGILGTLWTSQCVSFFSVSVPQRIHCC